MKNKKVLAVCLFYVIAMFAMIAFADLDAISGVAMAFAIAAMPVADEKGLKTDMTGTAASSSNLRDGELLRDEYDETIAKFQPYQFTLDTDMRRQCSSQKVKGYEIEHYISAAARLDCATETAVTNETAKKEIVVLPVSGENAVMFHEYSLIATNISGYDDSNKAVGQLILCVTASDSDIKVSAINGKRNGTSMYVPDIPAGTKLAVLSNSCTESQLHVSPENYMPKKVVKYLQKKIANIVLTDEFIAVAKKLDFYEQDIRDNALYNFRRKNERNLWIGAQSKRLISAGKNMGKEYAYTSEGVIPQIQNLYGYDDVINFDDLLLMCKMQFTRNSSSNEAVGYAGKDFIHALCNIDFTKHKDVEFTSRTVLGIDIRAFKCPFGTIEFKYCPTLDDIGYKSHCAIVDIKNARRYVKEDNKTISVDMKEGAGENREAKRDIFIEIDCLCLKGYNSILAGPATSIAGATGASGAPSLVMVDALADIANPKTGQIAYIKSEKTLHQYNGTDWGEYVGVAV